MINVLVVEDDQIAAEAHRLYVQRMPGFAVAGVVHSAGEARRFCQRSPVDVVLLDFYLPDTHGLSMCRALRAAGSTVDVIAVTSQKDLPAIHAAKSLGAVDYLLKPFAFAKMRDTLERYAQLRQYVPRSGKVIGQADVDAIWHGLGSASYLSRPKGISRETLDRIKKELSGTPDGLSATEAAARTKVSRVTARTYLKHLEETGVAQRTQHYGRGRPEDRFSLAHPLHDSEEVDDNDNGDDHS